MWRFCPKLSGEQAMLAQSPVTNRELVRMWRLYDSTCHLAFSLKTMPNCYSHRGTTNTTVCWAVKPGSESAAIFCAVVCSLGTGTGKACSAPVVDMQLFWVVWWLCPWHPSLDGRLGTVSPSFLSVLEALMFCLFLRTRCQNQFLA